jgi:hypothetical protein
MATDKKSFLLYCDLIHTVSKMPNDKAGELFKHILQYVNDENPITDDLIIQLTFEPIKQSLKRDLQKYENIRLKNIENANKRWNKINATAYDRMPNDTKNAVSVSDSVSVNDNDIKEDIDSRKLKFAHTLKEFSNTYSREMLKEFYDYWTETNDNGKKFRREMQRTWNLKLRLSKWHSNINTFKNGKSTITATDEFKQIVTAIRTDGIRR